MDVLLRDVKYVITYTTYVSYDLYA